MKIPARIIQAVFGIPWIVFGLQHFLYSQFVSTLVPAFMPFKLFWAYFTGAAMMAAGISFIINRFAQPAAVLLSLMLSLFILMIHVPALIFKTSGIAAWTRPLQDIELACAALLLAKLLFQRNDTNSAISQFSRFSRYLFACALVGFGIQQFFNLDFLTAKIPPYLPLRSVFVYLMGAMMIIAAIGVSVNRKTKTSLIALGFFMFAANLLNHGYLLATDVHQPILWTAAMLDVAVTCGVFILAGSSNNDKTQAK